MRNKRAGRSAHGKQIVTRDYGKAGHRKQAAAAQTATAEVTPGRAGWLAGWQAPPPPPTSARQLRFLAMVRGRGSPPAACVTPRSSPV